MALDFAPQVLEELAQHFTEKGYFPSKTDFERHVMESVKKAQTESATPIEKPSITRSVRGLAARQGKPINEATMEEDLAYVKRALTTGATSGSYLVPAIQASEIIQILSTYGVVRAAGARVWPMVGIEKLNIPTATALPTVEWLGENTASTASDPTLGQVALDLKTARALVAIPNELLTTSTPAIDALVTELLGIAHGEAEDTAFFATANTTNGPNSMYANAGTSRNAAAGSANGGTVTYADLLLNLKDFYAAKAKAPAVYFTGPRTFFSSILGMLDLQSRPLIVQDSQGPVQFRLFGFPVFISPLIPEDQTVGSGTSLSYLILTNPRYIHIGEPGSVEIAVSTEFYFDKNQTAIRSVHRVDFGYAPSTGICRLRGIA